MDFAEIFQLAKKAECLGIYPFGDFVLETLLDDSKQMDVWIHFFTASNFLIKPFLYLTFS